jgi:glycosyltransferase involved in cell wall biosynthesis
MKLVIQIPCYNEEKTLPLVLKELPKKVPGIDQIEVQIIDDGSKDNTIEVAKKFGVTRIIRHKRNLGLGTSFKDGVDAALAAGADILINTDGDNQYPSRYIPELVKPILNGKADIVIGNRQPWKVQHFSPFKRILQWFGNGLVRRIAGSNVPDTVSGFRAYNKESMLRINVTTKFSYVLDTIVQATNKGLTITSIPIDTNAPTRKSRLFKNIFQHMRKSGSNIIRCFIVYQPFQTFGILAWLFATPAIILLARFLINYFLNTGAGLIQSLIVAAILFFFSGSMLVLGILAELLGTNRKLVEEQIYLKKKEMFEK